MTIAVVWNRRGLDTCRATRLVELLRPHLTSLAAPEVIELLDRIAIGFPRVAQQLAAAVAAADVQRSVAPLKSIVANTRNADVDPIVAFYRGERPDAAGRPIADIWEWDDRRLEAVHDFIQWLFPTSQRSAVNASAPLVTRDTIAAFAADKELRRRLLRSFDRMLRFYGLERVEGDTAAEIRSGGNYEARKTNWLRPGNHNHLRITRILTALELLGLPNEALALRECLRRIYEAEGTACITAATFRFWMGVSG